MLRLLIAGDVRRRPDEGMRRVAQDLRRALEEVAVVEDFDLGRAGARDEWAKARRFRPDAALYVPGPSLRSFALLRALKAWTGAKATGALTLNPEGLGPAPLQRALAPDLLFVHSTATEARFRALGVDTHFLPMGVDLARFSPPTPEEKAAARARFGLPDGRRVVLHVGHLKRSRNLEALLPLAREEHVLVVGSTATEEDKALVRDLEAGGVRVVREFLPDVQQAYHAADAYAFPTVQANNATEIPISILEALACGLPVVTTPYGAIPRVFGDLRAVRVCAPEDFAEATAKSLSTISPLDARSEALRFSWPTIVRALAGAFEGRLRHG